MVGDVQKVLRRMNRKHKANQIDVIITPEFQSRPQWKFLKTLPQEVISFEISKYSLEEERVCSGTLFHHLDKPKTNHTASFPLLPRSVCKPVHIKGQLRFVPTYTACFISRVHITQRLWPKLKKCFTI